MYTFYGYPKCSTCKKAVKHLENKGIFPEYIDIKLNPPTADQLKDWMLQSKLPIRRFFNTSGMKYKELHLKDKIDALSMEEACALLATDETTPFNGLENSQTAFSASTSTTGMPA